MKKGKDLIAIYSGDTLMEGDDTVLAGIFPNLFVDFEAKVVLDISVLVAYIKALYQRTLLNKYISQHYITGTEVFFLIILATGGS